MEFELEKEPDKPVIIEGFPGFGLVSTICTEFLIKHLDAKKIGKVVSDDVQPIAALHQGEVIDPLEVYYDEKHNIVILRALGDVAGNEWELATIIEKLGKKLNAKEVISLEGVAGEKEKNDEKGGSGEEHPTFYFTDDKEKGEDYEKADMKKLDNGIIKGVTAALILQMKDMDISFSSIFVKAHPGLPDSRAAGEVIKALDKYLGLKVDYKPLMKTAEKMEKKLKKLASQAKQARERKVKGGKESYLG